VFQSQVNLHAKITVNLKEEEKKRQEEIAKQLGG
jgi:hypothetical protein